MSSEAALMYMHSILMYMHSNSEAALMYMNSMIIYHITYCLTTWSQASITTLKPLESLYKQSQKNLD